MRPRWNLYADISDHVRTSDTGDGRERCEACGYLWPCPDVRMAPPELTADERAVMEMVDFGWVVWERLPDDGFDIGHREARGGTVVAWEDDDEGHRTYRCLAGFPKRRPHFVYLQAAEVNPTADVGVCLPNPSTLRSHYRRVAACVGAEKGISDATETEYLALALTLSTAVNGRPRL